MERCGKQCKEAMDRATRPNHPSSEPEMLPDRPLPTSVGMDPSPPPLGIASSITPSLVPTYASDEASVSFHSTPDFHHTPQTLASHTGPSDFYTGPTPVVSTTTPGPDLYTTIRVRWTSHGSVCQDAISTWLNRTMDIHHVSVSQPSCSCHGTVYRILCIREHQTVELMYASERIGVNC